MKGDSRALPSEEFALRQLGLDTRHCIKSEEELLYECNGFGHVPEGIFKHPKSRKVVSVEVKRIVGNSLPKECGGRLIRRRKHIVWPWNSTVFAAMDKASEFIVNTYNIQEHHICVVIPDSLNEKACNRLHTHILDAMNYYFDVKQTSIKHKQFHLHIMKGPSELFDRFC